MSESGMAPSTGFSCWTTAHQRSKERRVGYSPMTRSCWLDISTSGPKLGRHLLASSDSTDLHLRTLDVRSQSSCLWHCPRCGASMIVVQRFTAAEPSALHLLRFFLTHPSAATGGCAPARRCIRVLASAKHFLCGFPILSLPLPRTTTPPLSPFSAARSSPMPISDCHSNPIALRVRRKRQRLPPSLLS